MASNKAFKFGPVAVPSTAGDLFNPKTTSGGVNAGQTGNT